MLKRLSDGWAFKLGKIEPVFPSIRTWIFLCKVSPTFALLTPGSKVWVSMIACAGSHGASSG